MQLWLSLPCCLVVALTLEFDIIINSLAACVRILHWPSLCFNCLLCKCFSGKICTFSKTTVVLNIEIEDSYEDFLGILMKYQLEGRYPDYNPVLPTKEKVIEYLNKTKEMLTWIERKL